MLFVLLMCGINDVNFCFSRSLSPGGADAAVIAAGRVSALPRPASPSPSSASAKGDALQDLQVGTLFHEQRFSLTISSKHSKNDRVAVISAKNHKRQRRKRQSVTAKREKSQPPKVLTAVLTLPNLTDLTYTNFGV